MPAPPAAAEKGPFTPGYRGARAVLYVSARTAHLIMLASALPLSIVLAWRKDIFIGIAGGFAVFGSLVWLLLFFLLSSYAFPLRIRDALAVILSFIASVVVVTAVSADAVIYGAYQTVLGSLPAYTLFLAVLSVYYLLLPIVKPGTPRAVPLWAFPFYGVMVAGMVLLFLIVGKPFFAELSIGGLSAAVKACVFLTVAASYGLPLRTIAMRSDDAASRMRQSLFNRWAPAIVGAMLASIGASIIAVLILSELGVKR